MCYQRRAMTRSKSKEANSSSALSSNSASNHGVPITVVAEDTHEYFASSRQRSLANSVTVQIPTFDSSISMKVNDAREVTPTSTGTPSSPASAASPTSSVSAEAASLAQPPVIESTPLLLTSTAEPDLFAFLTVSEPSAAADRVEDPSPAQANPPTHLFPHS
jgi:hypothetical protein